ncbi:MAG: DUF192 domain-containing protein [Opitutaceae bacterium]|nr:DUF192 domain-containing protein [Opitutaceae bacterium]
MFSLTRQKIPFTILALMTVLLLAACGADRKETVTKTVDDFFEIKLGERVIKMQIAVLPGEVQRGLMFRKTMGWDEGMLFAFRRPQTMSFFMRNTSLPLDIGYISGTGELKEIYPMYPFDERTVISHGNDLQYALEMNQGWFKDRGVKPGDKLDLKALAAALKARGLDLQAAEMP